MKIGIMTFQLQGNYGAILQNFALQKYLRSKGHRPITIQWETEFNSWKSYLRGLYYMFKDWRKIKYHVWPTRPGHFRLHKENGGRRGFVKKHIKLSRACLIGDLHNLVIKSKFDALIVGSDQVWRPSFIPDIDIMFLSFAQGLFVKRIAYAASLGVSYNDFKPSQLQECSRLLRNFDVVGVREDIAVRQCEELFQYENAKWVPDPTFLIDREVYDESCKSVPPKYNILFAYILDENPEKLAYIKGYASKNNLEAIIKYEKGTPKDTVEEWLALFRDAEYVVTDSFHGIVFSLIYHKKFTLFTNSYRGNVRVESLLRQINIEEYCNESSEILSKYTPDWNLVAKQINHWRQVGEDFLVSSLKS